MDAIPDIVDLVLWLLAALSVLTWTIMFVKLYGLWRNDKGNREVLRVFGEARQIGEIRLDDEAMRGPLARLYSAGRQELQALQADQPNELDHKDRREMLQHALRQQIHTEQSQMENGMAFLASVGSTSPFIGLFGTVWGIMHALKSISSSGSAGLDVVAGPIGEALIATAMGIAAAIPAVLAYNYFLRRVRLSVAAMDHFADRFLHLVIKSGLGGK